MSPLDGIDACLVDLEVRRSGRAALAANSGADLDEERQPGPIGPRERRTVARQALCLLLSERLGLPAADVRVAYEPSGKPYLPGRPGTGISWSFSHGLMLLAVARGGPVGVDLEVIRPIPGALDVLSAVYPHTPPTARPDAFFPAWTLLEAAVKATGRGLARGAADVDLVFLPEGAVALGGILDRSGRRWNGHTIRLPSGRAGEWAMAAFVGPVTMSLEPTWYPTAPGTFGVPGLT